MSPALNRITALLMVLIVASAVTGGAAAAGGQNARPPKVIQLSYDESDDGSSPSRSLYAFVRHPTDSVRFVTRYHGRTATAETRYKPQITDTDIRGRKARHPWALIRKGGGKRVLSFIHKSLERRGTAQVRIRARRDGLLDDVRARIVLAECAQDPPLYPVSCEVRP